jgi:hypothetical protein
MAERWINRKRRHPADVTADRLGDAIEKYDFTTEERDEISHVIDALRRISEGHEENSQ